MAGSPLARPGRRRRDRRRGRRIQRRHRAGRSGVPGSLCVGRRGGGRGLAAVVCATAQGDRLRRRAGGRGPRLVCLDRLVADAAGILRRRRPLARGRGSGRRRHGAGRTGAPPARGRRVGAVRSLAAADRVRHPAACARRVLPDLAATAGRARLSQRDRGLRRARGARRAVARELPAARPARRGLRHAGAARTRPGAVLVARRRAGSSDRLRRSGWPSPTGAPRAARRCSPCSSRPRLRPAGGSISPPSRRSTCPSPCPRARA